MRLSLAQTLGVLFNYASLAVLVAWMTYQFGLPGGLMMLGLIGGGMFGRVIVHRSRAVIIGFVVGATAGALLGTALDIWWSYIR